jgi:antitoxin ParD1/3/4
MTARNVNLTERLNTFIDSQVASGRHQNASEVVREALRRYERDMEAEVASVAALRAVIREGREDIARGDFIRVSGPADEARLFAEWTGRAKPAAG